jgi:hypothetical protein
MSRILSVVLALLIGAAALSTTPVAAQEIYSLRAQVALLPLSDADHSDIESVVKTLWKPYFNAGGELGFFRDALRAGLIDLNEDGVPELLVMIDAPRWQAAGGLPFVVAQWTAKGWSPIGWGWGDPDSVFVTAERLGGWATIDTPTQWLRWNGKALQGTDKPKSTAAQ